MFLIWKYFDCVTLLDETKLYWHCECWEYRKALSENEDVEVLQVCVKWWKENLLDSCKLHVAVALHCVNWYCIWEESQSVVCVKVKPRMKILCKWRVDCMHQNSMSLFYQLTSWLADGSLQGMEIQQVLFPEILGSWDGTVKNNMILLVCKHSNVS